MAVVPSQVNENFIKACRDGDLESFNQLVVQADVNYVSESGGLCLVVRVITVLFSSWH